MKNNDCFEYRPSFLLTVGAIDAASFPGQLLVVCTPFVWIDIAFRRDFDAHTISSNTQGKQERGPRHLFLNLYVKVEVKRFVHR